MGGRQWTVEEASSSKLVLSRVRLEDEDVNFSAAKVAVREEIRQRLQDIRHFEEEHKVLFEKDQRAGKSSIRDVTFSCIEQKETVELPAGHFCSGRRAEQQPCDVLASSC